MLGDILEEIAMTTVLGDEVAVVAFFHDSLEPEYAGMIQFFEDLYFIFKHFEARRGVLADIDNFKRILRVIFDAMASIDVTCITRSYLIFFTIDVVAYFFYIFCQKVGLFDDLQVVSRPNFSQLPRIFFLERLGGRDLLLQRQMSLVHYIDEGQLRVQIKMYRQLGSFICRGDLHEGSMALDNFKFYFTGKQLCGFIEIGSDRFNKKICLCLVCFQHQSLSIIFVVRLLRLQYNHFQFCLLYNTLQVSMPMIYTLIARGKIVLVDYTPHSGDFIQHAHKVLNKTNHSVTFGKYVTQKHCFYTYFRENYVFLVMVESDYEMRVAVDFLKRIQDLFFRRFSRSRRQSATTYSLNEFKPILYDWMQKYSNVAEVDKLHQIKKELSQVQQQSLKNMNDLLERGQRISLLVKKTEDLSQQTLDMEQLGHKLKNKMWWQNKKLTLGIIALLIILLVIVLILLIR